MDEESKKRIEMRQYKEARTFHETPSHPPPVGGRERHAVLSTYRRSVSVTVKKHGGNTQDKHISRGEEEKRRESTEEEGFNSQDTRAKHATEEGHHHRGRDEE